RGAPRGDDKLMGWTSSGDMRQQVQLRFDTLEEAVAYCERHGIAYQIFKSKAPVRHGMSYADNFAANRRDPWTH
ncbi:MAG: NADH dehydrogenase ubiquinone Fe-S protein 4, partial [Xanthobacteraceae bacterium]